jgi:hypothetical protein
VRKPRRWPVVLLALLCVFGLIALLSALIEAPAADVEPAPDNHPVSAAVLLPAVMPSPETAPDARSINGACLPFVLLASLSLLLPPPVAGRDANGRVLRRRRYARSFYPVFRQELACG